MSQNKDRKVLRIGVIQHGKVVEEHVVRRNGDVTIGQMPRNTVMLTSSRLPEQFPLFVYRQGQYFLRYTRGFHGKLSDDKGMTLLHQPKVEGKEDDAKIVGTTEWREHEDSPAVMRPLLELPLKRSVRGKVEFDDVTLLFQFVTPPPLPEQPAFATPWRSFWKQGFDWTFAVILMTSFVGHTGFVAWCNAMGTLPAASLDKRFTRRIYELPPLIVPPRPAPVLTKKKEPTDKKPEGNKKEASKAKKSPRSRAGRKKAPRSRSQRRPTRRELEKLIEGAGLLNALKLGQGGALGHVLSSKNGSKLAKSLSKATGFGDVASRGLPRRRRRIGRGPGMLNTSAADYVKSGDGLADGRIGGGRYGCRRCGKRAKRTKIKLPQPTFESIPEGRLNPKTLLRYLQRKANHLRYCYERRIKRDKTLHGKIVLRLKVAVTGRVVETEIEEDSVGSDVGRCILRRLKRLRFPKPKGEAASVSVPFIFSAS